MTESLKKPKHQVSFQQEESSISKVNESMNLKPDSPSKDYPTKDLGFESDMGAQLEKEYHHHLRMKEEIRERIEKM